MDIESMDCHPSVDGLLLLAAGAMTQASNSLPEHERELLALALAQGARLELRIMADQEKLSLWLHSPSGEAREVAVSAPAAN